MSNVSNSGTTSAVCPASGCFLLLLETILFCHFDPLLKVLLVLLCLSDRALPTNNSLINCPLSPKYNPSLHISYFLDLHFTWSSLFVSLFFLLTLPLLNFYMCLYVYTQMHIYSNIYFVLFCGYVIKLRFTKIVLVKVLLLLWESMSPISVLHKHHR